MGKIYTGNANFANPFHYTSAYPIDDRLVVKQYSDLKDSSTFTVNGVNTAYKGMVVSIADTGQLFTCTDADNLIWKPCGVLPNINELLYSKIENGETVGSSQPFMLEDFMVAKNPEEVIICKNSKLQEGNILENFEQFALYSNTIGSPNLFSNSASSIIYESLNNRDFGKSIDDDFSEGWNRYNLGFYGYGQFYQKLELNRGIFIGNPANSTDQVGYISAKAYPTFYCDTIFGKFSKNYKNPTTIKSQYQYNTTTFGNAGFFLVNDSEFIPRRIEYNLVMYYRSPNNDINSNTLNDLLNRTFDLTNYLVGYNSLRSNNPDLSDCYCAWKSKNGDIVYSNKRVDFTVIGGANYDENHNYENEKIGVTLHYVESISNIYDSNLNELINAEYTYYDPNGIIYMLYVNCFPTSGTYNYCRFIDDNSPKSYAWTEHSSIFIYPTKVDFSTENCNISHTFRTGVTTLNGANILLITDNLPINYNGLISFKEGLRLLPVQNNNLYSLNPEDLIRVLMTYDEGKLILKYSKRKKTYTSDTCDKVANPTYDNCYADSIKQEDLDNELSLEKDNAVTVIIDFKNKHLYTQGGETDIYKEFPVSTEETPFEEFPWDKFTGELKVMYTAYSVQHLYIRSLEFSTTVLNKDKILDLYNNQVIKYNKIGLNFTVESDSEISDYFPGSHQSYNPITKKLWYSNGYDIYLISAIPEDLTLTLDFQTAVDNTGDYLLPAVGDSFSTAIGKLTRLLNQINGKLDIIIGETIND